MRVLFGTILIIFFCLKCFGQNEVKKEPLSNFSFQNWEELGEYSASPDGSFIYFFSSTLDSGRKLHLTDRKGDVKQIFNKVTNAQFSNDGRFLIFLSHEDAQNEKLVIHNLENNFSRFIEKAINFRLSPSVAAKWMCVQLADAILMFEFHSMRSVNIPNASNSLFFPNGSSLVYQDNEKKAVVWLELSSWEKSIIYDGEAYGDFNFDSLGRQLVFSSKDHLGQNVVVYYNTISRNSKVILSNNSIGLKPGFLLAGPVSPRFNKSDDAIIFKLKSAEITRTRSLGNVLIWKSSDEFILPQRLKGDVRQTPTSLYSGIYQINTGKIIQLDDEKTFLLGEPIGKCVLTRNVTNDQEAHWRSRENPSYSVTNIFTGERFCIIDSLKRTRSGTVTLSPDGGFVTWYDYLKENFMLFDIATRTTRALTGLIPYRIFSNDSDISPGVSVPFGAAPEWIYEGKKAIIYDEYDIWLVDPKGKQDAINITNGYGRKNNMCFRLAVSAQELNGLRENDSVLVWVSSPETKKNGFQKIKLGVNRRFQTPVLHSWSADFPKKIPRTDFYLIKVQSVISAPNLKVTRDFKSFSSISHLAPQSRFNWMTAELMHWKMHDGKVGTGILYKPEDFEPNRKYPVIFNYYEIKSKSLYQFKNPGLSIGDLNIPWYVSNGYLVFVPDIPKIMGNPGIAALTSVVSAAEYLSTLSYVDAAKLGLQGHSFGAYETNYIVAHSNLFGAAQSSAGISDLLVFYQSLSFGGKSMVYHSERGQFFMHSTPWDSTNQYIKNSVTGFIPNINTPMLIMHNQDDFQSPFSQSVGLFILLRRMGKPSWLLQYLGEGHTIDNAENKIDFTIKQQEFFDYYLRDGKKPSWM